MNKADEEFIKSVKGILENSTENLDATTRSQLTSVRYQALATKDKEDRTWLVPAGAFASLVVGMLVFTIWSGNSEQENLSLMEDMELLSSGESFELLEELEFYEWLGSQNGWQAG